MLNELSECESEVDKVVKDYEDKDNEDGKVEGNKVNDKDEVGDEDEVSEGNKDEEIDDYVDSDDNNEKFKAELEKLRVKYNK